MITLSERQWRLDVRKQNHDSDGVCISDLILHRFLRSHVIVFSIVFQLFCTVR